MSDREEIIGLIAVHVWRCFVFLQQVAAHANEALRLMEMYRLYQQQVSGWAFYFHPNKEIKINAWYIQILWQ